ncbi:MAG: site-2 protease family protein [Patescibacteria group bacterium]
MLLSLLFQQPILFFAWAAAFLIALSFHEFSHALVATWLGDNTAKRMGRLTLNPVAHIDPIGLLAVFLIGFGWGKPVPYNPYNLKWPKWGPTVVAAAGPISNLFMALVTGILAFLLAPKFGCDNLLIIFLSIMTELNLALMVFNLIPLPPLDGSKALLAVLDGPQYAGFRQFIETKGQLVLFGLILIDAILGIGLFAGLFAGATAVFGHIVPLVCSI